MRGADPPLDHEEHSLMAFPLTLPRAARGRHHQHPDPPKRKRVRVHQPKPADSPPADDDTEQTDPPAHHAYARDGDGTPNYQNWRTCTCDLGCDHLDD